MPSTQPPEPRKVKRIISAQPFRPFPGPDEPEERLSSVLSAINTESKSAVLAFCLDSDPRTCHDIKKLLDYTVGDVWTPTPPVFGMHCRQTFIPIGSVAEQTVVFKEGGRKSGARAWVISPAGEKYAKPIAAFTMKYAVDHGISMYSILGVVHSSGESRAPYNRVRILEGLKGKDMKEIELANSLNLKSNSVIEHTKTFEALGFLENHTAGSGQPNRSGYGWVKGKNPADARPVPQRKRLTREVAKALYELGESDCNELAERVGYKHSSHVSNVLSGLDKQGFINSLLRKSLLQPGHDFLTEYSDKVRNALQDGPELQGMQEFQRELESNYPMRLELAHSAMKLFEQVSFGRNRRIKEDVEGMVLDFIRDYPDRRGPKSWEIVENCGGGTRNYLPELLKSGILTREKTGRETRYRLAD